MVRELRLQGEQARILAWLRETVVEQLAFTESLKSQMNELNGFLEDLEDQIIRRKELCCYLQEQIQAYEAKLSETTVTP